jgi:hypothetical protein
MIWVKLCVVCFSNRNNMSKLFIMCLALTPLVYKSFLFGSHFDYSILFFVVTVGAVVHSMEKQSYKS